MIDLKELRIGNYIFSNSSKLPYWEISSEDFSFMNGHEVHYHPVELTEEWLIKLGFKNTYDQYFEHENMPFFELLDSGRGEGYNNGWRMFNNSGNSIIFAIKSVHQLQNLYYALTGDELCVK